MQDTYPQPPNWVPSVTALASAIDALITFFYLFSIPADPKNSLLLGYSASRLILMAAMLAATVLCFFLFLHTRRNILKTQQFIMGWMQSRKKVNLLFLLSGFLFLVCWILSWTPPYRMGQFDLEFERVKPLIIWFTLFLGQFIMMLLVYRFGIRKNLLKNIFKQYPDHRQKILVVLAILLFSWGLISITGLGITPDSSFWNDHAIPVLAVQSLLAWAAGFALLLIPSIPEKLQFHWKIDGILCLLLWVIAATLWITQPQLPSFFAPEPAPPNDSYYPMSDAAEYDMNAQFALIGQGLYNGNHVDKPLYSTLLVMLHLLAGQDFDLLAALQATFFALLPVFLYLTGKMLHSRAAGVTAALLSIFKGRNAIASSWMILSVNPKLFLSEYPMALGLAFLTLLLVIWMTRKNHGPIFPLAIGGVFGLLALIRHNIWLMLPVILVLAGFQAGWRWRKWLFSNAMIISALFITIGPWMWRSYQIWHDPWFFLIGLRTEVLQNRYHLDFTSNTTQPTAENTNQETEKVSDLNELAYDPQPQLVWMGKYDDSISVIHYTDDWLQMNDSDSHDQTLSYSSVEGSQASLNFNGDSVSIFFKSHPAHGKMEVSIDGKIIAIIDQYDSVEKSGQIWKSADLSQGDHELVLTHKSGKLVSLDAIQVESQPRQLLRTDDCPDIAYNWVHANYAVNLYKDPVTYLLPFLFNLDGELYSEIHIYRDGHLAFGKSLTNPDLHESAAILVPFDEKIDLTLGGEVYIDRFFFSPTQVFIIEYQNIPLQDGNGYATYEVVLFEENNDILFQYNEIPKNSVAYITANDMQTGFQDMSFNNLNDEMTLAFSTEAQFCSAQPSMIYDKGFYDDNELSGYDWAWRPFHQNGFGLNDSHHFSVSPESKIRFRFSGEQIGLVFSRRGGMGKMKVTIDGDTYVINQYGEELKQQEVWESPHLSEGEHTITLEHAGKIGESVGIDAILIDTSLQAFLSSTEAKENTTKPDTATESIAPTINADDSDSITTKPEEEQDSSTTLQFISAHFAHNLVTTFFTLPVSLANDDIQHTLQNPEGIWAQDWAGMLSSREILMVFFNLLILAIGIGCTWSHFKIAGLVPLLTYLTYNLGTAAARTSGGRYIVPVDWVLPLYFAVGLIQLTLWLSPPIKSNFAHLTNTAASITDKNIKKTGASNTIFRSTVILAVMLALGASPVLADHIFPQEYQHKEKNDLFYELIADGSIEKMGFNSNEISAFIHDENSFIWQGRALYPRFYHADSGEPAKGPYRIMDFPRIVFTVVGPDTEKAGHAVLPTTIYPDHFPHFSDVIVIGCEDCDANVLAVIVHGTEDTIYVRTPETTLHCPFETPQCDGDHCQ